MSWVYGRQFGIKDRPAIMKLLPRSFHLGSRRKEEKRGRGGHVEDNEEEDEESTVGELAVEESENEQEEGEGDKDEAGAERSDNPVDEEVGRQTHKRRKKKKKKGTKRKRRKKKNERDTTTTEEQTARQENSEPQHSTDEEGREKTSFEEEEWRLHHEREQVSPPFTRWSLRVLTLYCIINSLLLFGIYVVLIVLTVVERDGLRLYVALMAAPPATILRHYLIKKNLTHHKNAFPRYTLGMLPPHPPPPFLLPFTPHLPLKFSGECAGYWFGCCVVLCVLYLRASQHTCRC